MSVHEYLNLDTEHNLNKVAEEGYQNWAPLSIKDSNPKAGDRVYYYHDDGTYTIMMARTILK